MSLSDETATYKNLDEYQNRLQKLQEIRALGVEPYPHKYTPTHRADELSKHWQSEELGQSDDAMAGSTPEVCLAGRLVLFRAMGKNAFGHIQDSTGRVQVMFNRDRSKVSGYAPELSDVSQAPSHIKFIEKKLDLGDHIGIRGHLFRTQKGELTVLVTELTLLCKSLLPLADKHGGLVDKETRYRKRWLDLIANPEVGQVFHLRSVILNELREFMKDEGFMEVETPALQKLYGGAAARPFETHLHALDQHMYMRISLEIPLKKLIVGGFERVYEIGRVFRNESIDRNHNPEFTELEAYAAYWDYHDMMDFTERLFERVAHVCHGSTRVPYGEDKDGKPLFIDVKGPWKRLTMKDSIKEYAQLDVDTLDDKALIQYLLKTGNYEPEQLKDHPRGLLIAELFEELVEDKLIQPHHIIDHPQETTPLCKHHRHAKFRQEGLVERFESYILGNEICNSYSELNDPLIQRQLLEDQQKQLSSGDVEAHPLDDEFLEALAQGMPPTAGIGFGVDRMIMLFTGMKTIRDVLLFPWMK